jgi:hypothetical protein
VAGFPTLYAKRTKQPRPPELTQQKPPPDGQAEASCSSNATGQTG